MTGLEEQKRTARAGTQLFRALSVRRLHLYIGKEIANPELNMADPREEFGKLVQRGRVTTGVWVRAVSRRDRIVAYRTGAASGGPAGGSTTNTCDFRLW